MNGLNNIVYGVGHEMQANPKLEPFKKKEVIDKVGYFDFVKKELDRAITDITGKISYLKKKEEKT